MDEETWATRHRLGYGWSASVTARALTSESCLTAAQVERVEALYGPSKSNGGLELYPGPTISAALAPSSPAKSDATALPAPLRNALKEFGYTNEPTLARFDADKDIPPMDAIMNPVMSSMDADISRFRRRGGKILVWQGWSDPAISPYNTLYYYDQVKTKDRREHGRFLPNFLRVRYGALWGGS